MVRFSFKSQFAKLQNHTSSSHASWVSALALVVGMTLTSPAAYAQNSPTNAAEKNVKGTVNGQTAGTLLKSLYVNIPVTDLARAKNFYTAIGAKAKNIGASNDPQLVETNTVFVVWEENIEILLLSREFFEAATEKRVADTKTTAQVVLAFSATSRDEVDAKIQAGLAAGGSERIPPQDQEHMYARYLDDPDGNLVEFIYLDGK
jgi:uncharacterized protein